MNRLPPWVWAMAFVELAVGVIEGFLPPLLPALGRLHQIGPGPLAWVVTTALLASAVFVPILTKLGDIYGHRRLLRVCVAVDVLGTLLMALAPSFGVLLLARVLMAPMQACLPLEIAITRGLPRGEDVRRGIGLLAGSLMGGLALGRVLAGYIQGLTGSVQLTLLVLPLLVLLSLAAVFVLVPETTERAARRIDGLGFAGLAAALLLLELGLSQIKAAGWASVIVLAPIIAAVVLVLPLWGWWELRTPEPAVDLRMLGRRAMWPLQLAGMLFAASLFNGHTAHALFLAGDPGVTGYGMKLTPAQVGLTLLPDTLVAIVAAVCTARIARRIGLRWTVSGGALFLAGGYGLLCLVPTQPWQFAVISGVYGVGNGLLSSGLPTLVAERSPAGHVGITTGMYNTLRTVGGGFAGGLFAVILSNVLITGGPHLPSVTAYQLIWATCALAAALTAALILATTGAQTTAPTARESGLLSG
ncbi:MFS transporter [Pseudonocardia acaciae]|uniref:MFS transporter n=1 Tax=Pseudonocardia acaciae TaxID=551276 RepID=UPI00048D5D2C|nr:MFS transporter [Pseudonocardia acaciae]